MAARSCTIVTASVTYDIGQAGITAEWNSLMALLLLLILPGIATTSSAGACHTVTPDVRCTEACHVSSTDPCLLADSWLHGVLRCKHADRAVGRGSGQSLVVVPVFPSSAVSAGLEPGAPVVILTLPHVASWNCQPAVSALLAVQLVYSQALLMNQAFSLVQTCLHADEHSSPTSDCNRHMNLYSRSENKKSELLFPTHIQENRHASV